MKYQTRYRHGKLYYIKDGNAYEDIEFTKKCKYPQKAYLIRQDDNFEEWLFDTSLLQFPDVSVQSIDSDDIDNDFIHMNGYIKEDWEDNNDTIGFNF